MFKNKLMRNLMVVFKVAAAPVTYIVFIIVLKNTTEKRY